jgi:hypothetical protein
MYPYGAHRSAPLASDPSARVWTKQWRWPIICSETLIKAMDGKVDALEAR